MGMEGVDKRKVLGSKQWYSIIAVIAVIGTLVIAAIMYLGLDPQIFSVVSLTLNTDVVV